MLEKPKPGKWEFEVENKSSDLLKFSASTPDESSYFFNEVQNYLKTIDTCTHSFTVENYVVGGPTQILYSLFSKEFPFIDFGSQYHKFSVSDNSLEFLELYELFNNGSRTYQTKTHVDGSFSDTNFDYVYSSENFDYTGARKWEGGFAHRIRGKWVGACPDAAGS
jgi:hypothetical protein